MCATLVQPLQVVVRFQPQSVEQVGLELAGLLEEEHSVMSERGDLFLGGELAPTAPAGSVELLVSLAGTGVELQQAGPCHGQSQGDHGKQPGADPGKR